MGVGLEFCLAQNFGQSLHCQVNVNCPEGDAWQNQSRGVALVIDDSNADCTGSLINNTNFDGTPYFLMASHCLDFGDGSVGDHIDWTFLWGYESSNCDDAMPRDTHTTTGATIVALNTDTDMLLLLLDENPADLGIDVYYNGWSRSSSLPTSGAMIHHPRGDIKKIATISEPFSSGGSCPIAQGLPPFQSINYFFINQWANTTNGHSAPEGISSGSPVFNQNGLIAAHWRRSCTGNCPTSSQQRGGLVWANCCFLEFWYTKS